ncbi:hypothetical protein ACOSP7_011441 [Xanthoceras sorbifolium]
MANHNAVMSLLVITCALTVVAFEPSSLQDFCVADPSSSARVNGLACLDSKLAQPNHFSFSGFHVAGNTSNPLGSRVTLVSVTQIPGVNTLGISMNRIDYAPWGVVPPHIHPRASEILTVIEGTILVGFVTSNPDNRLISKILYKGDVFVFPVGLVHFQRSWSNQNAVSISGLSSQNPGVITVANAVFGSNPSIADDLLAKAFQREREKIVELFRVSTTQELSVSQSHLQVAKMVATTPFTVDLNKPLVFQVGYLGEAYNEWVHQPIVSKEGPRFFANGFLEFLTRTKWWVIPLVWLPVSCWLVSISLRMGLTPPQAALTVVGGIFIWTLMEYLLHRFLFHIKTTSYFANTLHYLLHGCHHKHPMDGLRLVFPPAATAILCVPLWTMFKLLSPPSIAPALFGGALLGYVTYDCTHYYLHHGKASKGYGRHLKRYHLNHHFRIQDKGFGITSSLWDRVFGTVPSTSKTAKKTDDDDTPSN